MDPSSLLATVQVVTASPLIAKKLRICLAPAMPVDKANLAKAQGILRSELRVVVIARPCLYGLSSRWQIAIYLQPASGLDEVHRTSQPGQTNQGRQKYQRSWAKVPYRGSGAG